MLHYYKSKHMSCSRYSFDMEKLQEMQFECSLKDGKHR